jgi:xanthine/CO dehydrogenase XdhC/CoxF family maturation factor
LRAAVVGRYVSVLIHRSLRDAKRLPEEFEWTVLESAANACRATKRRAPIPIFREEPRVGAFQSGNIVVNLEDAGERPTTTSVTHARCSSSNNERRASLNQAHACRCHTDDRSRFGLVQRSDQIPLPQGIERREEICIRVKEGVGDLDRHAFATFEDVN